MALIPRRRRKQAKNAQKGVLKALKEKRLGLISTKEESPVLQENNRNEDGTFKKGTSGNPNGRPKKGFAISDILDELGDKVVSDSKTLKELVLEKVYDMALGGDLNSIKFIADRTEGTALHKMSVTSNEPIQVMKIKEADETTV